MFEFKDIGAADSFPTAISNNLVHKTFGLVTLFTINYKQKFKFVICRYPRLTWFSVLNLVISSFVLSHTYDSFAFRVVRDDRTLFTTILTQSSFHLHSHQVIQICSTFTGTFNSSLFVYAVALVRISYKIVDTSPFTEERSLSHYFLLL